jgi:hypothetical protein
MTVAQLGISARIANYGFAVQTAKGSAAALPTLKVFANGAPSLQPYNDEARYNMTDGSRDAGDPYITQLGVRGSLPIYAHPDAMAFLWHAALGATVDAPLVQTITLSGDTGTLTFKLTYNGVEGATVFTRGTNQTAAAIQAALRTATGDASLTVTGTTDAGPFVVTFVTITNPFMLSVTSGTGGLTGVVTADPTTHVATPANDLPWLTIWRSVGGVVFEKYTDCKIDTLTIDGAAGAPLMVTLGIIGITSTFGADEAGAAITQTAPYLYQHAVNALKVDTIAYPIHAINVEVNNNLAPFQADDYFLNNVDPQAREITGSYTIRFSGATALPLDYRNYFYGSDAGTALTTGFSTHALAFIWTHSQLANRSMQVAIPVAKWADVPVQPDPGGNIIEVQCAFEAMRNWVAGNEAAIMTVTTIDGAGVS